MEEMTQLRELEMDEMRQTARNLSATLAATTGELAVCLYLIAENKWWKAWGYESPRAYAEEELGIRHSGFAEYVTAGRVAIIGELSLTEIRKLGKGKLAALESTVTKATDFKAALEYASGHTVRDLKSFADSLVKGPAKVHDRSVKAWSIKMPADSFEEAQRLLKMIELEQNTQLAGDALLHALREYWSRGTLRRVA